MEGNMHLSGQLSDWSISDLLSIMQVTAKTGSLDIDGERHGRVHFRDGRLTGAELTGTKGSYVGEDRGGVADVLYVLSTLEDGAFKVGKADGPEIKGWTVEEVITEVDALRSLEGEVVDAGLFEATGVRFVQEIEEPLTIEPDDWHVLVTLVPPFTFDHLEAKYGRGSAVRIFHTLHRLGMADAIVGEEAESDWLDRLAEEVAPGTADPAWMGQPTEEDPAAEIIPEPATEEVVEEVVEEVAEEPAPKGKKEPAALKGVSAPASTTLTDGVYDEIRRLRSKVSDN
jgi:hypothetical protein